MRTLAFTIAVSLGLAGCAAAPPAPDLAELTRQVTETERAFALTMAQRDHAAFTTFLSDEVLFLSGADVLRGPDRVAEAWRRYYEGAAAPFSWEPETVEVLESGKLALSTGPVRDPDGALIGTFTSIWRNESPGVWRIVFDKGCDVCD